MSRRLVLVFLVLASLAACGGKGPGAGGETRFDADADPFALLPEAAVLVATVDARGVYTSGPVGEQLATVTASLVPWGTDAGFLASRDVDRVIIGGYATGGADVAAVIVGHFDLDKIGRVTKAKNGAPVVKASYAGFATYTVGRVTYAPLTARTLVGGTADGVRRLLERVQKGNLERSFPPWVMETLQTPGAPFALAADLVSQPIASATLGSISLPWLKGMRVARVIGNLQPPGINVAATLTYGDAEQAQSASEGVRFVDGWLNLLGPLMGGLRLQNLDVTTDGGDLRCKFAVDDQALRTLLAMAPRFLPVLSQ